MTKKDLTNINGTVKAYLLNKAGQVDGLLLQDGKQLHLPPHCSAALQQAVKPGNTIEALVEPGEESPLGSDALKASRMPRLVKLLWTNPHHLNLS